MLKSRLSISDKIYQILLIALATSRLIALYLGINWRGILANDARICMKRKRRNEFGLTSLQPAIDPWDMLKKEWVLSREIIQQGKLIIEHHLEPADEAQAPNGLTHHLLAFQLSHGTRQIFRLHGQEYDGPLLPGEIHLIPANTPSFGAWESNDESLILIIQPMFLREIALELNFPNSDRVELLSVLKTRDFQLESIVLLIQNEIQQQNWGSSLYLDSLANMLGIHLLRNYTSHTPKLRKYEGGLSDVKLRQVLEYISAHLDRDIQLSDLAKIAGISQCYFASLFKQSMGITPWQYVLQQRIKQSKILLRKSNSSIVEIALQCGFRSQSHFTSSFRKITGCTPKMYKNS